MLLIGPKLPGIFNENKVFSAFESSLLSAKKFPKESISTESTPLFLPIIWKLNTIEGAPGPGTKVVLNINVFVLRGFKTVSLKLLSFEL